MARYDSADLLSISQMLMNRPSTDEAVTAAQWYVALTEAQSRVYQMLAFAHPEAVLSAPTKLVTTDSGLTYTFGADTGLPTNYQNISAEGYIVLLVSKTGPELQPGSDLDNSTDSFVFEDGVLRWPGGRARTFGDGPYCRFVTPSGTLDASTAPTLKPVHLRKLLPYDACKTMALRLGEDPNPWEVLFQTEWREQLLALKARFFGQGRANMRGPGGPWWRAFRTS